MPPFRWGLVGTGEFALEWIAPSLARAEGSTLAAVISRDAARARSAATRVGAPHAFGSIEAIDRSLVDGVVLVTPNSAHAGGAARAAARGLHVVVEKPMAQSVAACDEIMSAAATHGVMLAVAHCMEWSPAIVAARTLLADGAIGSVRSARIGASFLAEPGSLRRDGVAPASGPASAYGALFDMGVHAIDAVARLLGPVASVHARATGGGAGDAVATLTMQSGVEVQLWSRWSVDENFLEIQGTNGAIRSGEWWGREFAGDLTIERRGVTERVPLKPINVYDAQFVHLSACASSGSRPEISAQRGRANIQVIEAIVRSAVSGRPETPHDDNS